MTVAETFMLKPISSEAVAEAIKKAERIRPAGHDDSILRWNSYVRTIRRANIRPWDDEDELPLE